MKKLRVVLLKPGQAPEITEIEDSVTSMQTAVGGYFEIVSIDVSGVDRNLCALVDEEGGLKGLPFCTTIPRNFRGRLYQEDVVGNVVIAVADPPDIKGLTNNEARVVARYFNEIPV